MVVVNAFVKNLHIFFTHYFT